MDQKPASGNFFAPLNRYKQPGDNKPIFAGKLTAPASEAELPFALWAFDYTDKDGVVRKGYTGSINGIATNVPAKEQVEALTRAAAGSEVSVANLTLRPGQIVLFDNGFKNEDPQKNRPDTWGWVNPTDGSQPLRVSVWMRQFDDGRPYLSGATQYPLPGKTERQQQDAAAELGDLLTHGEVTQGMPEKKKARGGRD